MCSQLGSAIIVIPLIAILESVAIAKAFGKLYFHYISMYIIIIKLLLSSVLDIHLCSI